MYEDIDFITLTTSGYIDYTLNCVESLKRTNCDQPFHIHCIGNVGYKILQDNKVDNTYLIDDEKNSNFQEFRKGNWSNITAYKFDVIHKHLKTNKYVCFSDGDIVYENKDFLKYCLDNIGDNEALFQDNYPKDQNKVDICTGFMFIKSTERTIKYFDPQNVLNNKNTVGWDDQVYVNNNNSVIKFSLLPKDLFPVGRKYFQDHSVITPMMIHFNWVVGNNKRDIMKVYNKWYK